MTEFSRFRCRRFVIRGPWPKKWGFLCWLGMEIWSRPSICWLMSNSSLKFHRIPITLSPSLVKSKSSIADSAIFLELEILTRENYYTRYFFRIWSIRRNWCASGIRLETTFRCIYGDKNSHDDSSSRLLSNDAIVVSVGGLFTAWWSLQGRGTYWG